MPVSFAEFLEAKFDLDERSFNREVRETFWQLVHQLPEVECVDAGAGTGATVRRLLNGGLRAPLSLTALDRDPDLLGIARDNATNWLRASGHEPRIEASGVSTRGDPAIAIRFAVCELAEYRPQRRCNVITAHAFMDIVPLAETLRLFTAWLQPGGYLYASINYDGHTALLPAYDDAAFETRLLSHYGETMEQRRVNGLATGGAHCGRRLHRLLPEYAFDILAFGSSDWNITPSLGQYRGRDALCLQVLLDMIEAEGQKSGLFDWSQLVRWREDRMRLLDQRRLGLIVHQLDLLARYSP